MPQQLDLPLVSLGQYAEQNTFVINGQRISADEWPTHPQNSLAASEKNTLPSRLYYQMLSKGPEYALPWDWTSEKYAPLDISLEAYFKQQNISPEALRLMDANINALSLKELSTADAFYRLSPAASAEEVRKKSRGGNSRFIQALADDLTEELLTAKIVTSISQSSDKVAVRCEDGSQYIGKRCIITSPFSALKDVDIKGRYQPAKTPCDSACAVYTRYPSTFCSEKSSGCFYGAGHKLVDR
ncbi:FAD-dependent oxidoreductase [Paraglaciecola sp. Hal342]